MDPRLSKQKMVAHRNLVNVPKEWAVLSPQTCSRSVQLVTSGAEFVTQNLIVCELLEQNYSARLILTTCSAIYLLDSPQNE